ncbi:MAG TPA: hypothetical protein PLL90_02380, partial [Bacteroidales bacterium]|nr:hypothetical protein [Bacteroidales bacterium]
MKHLWAVVKKEYIQIIRDIPGLIILFLMPMVLILAVTGTQENAFEELNDAKADILFVDNDHEYLSKTIEDGLVKSGYFHVIKEFRGKPLDVSAAQHEIAAGNYQVGIVINQGATAYAREKARQRIHKSFISDTVPLAAKVQNDQVKTVSIIYDPATRDSYKNAVTSSLQRLILSVEVKIILSTFFDALPQELNTQLQQPIKKFLLEQL